MLQHQNVKLRGLEFEDLALLHEWMNNFDILRNLLRIDPSINYLTEKWFENINADKTKKIMAIEDVLSGKFIGCVGVNNIDCIDRKAEFYIYIGDLEFRGKHFAETSAGLFVRYMFDYYNLNKIYLHVREDNLPAINLYKKMGFKQEGLLREEKYIDGKYIDIIRMSLIKGELNQ